MAVSKAGAQGAGVLLFGAGGNQDCRCALTSSALAYIPVISARTSPTLDMRDVGELLFFSPKFPYEYSSAMRESALLASLREESKLLAESSDVQKAAAFWE